MPVPERMYRICPSLKEKLAAFYQKAGLRPEMNWDCLVLIREQERILAAGFREDQVLKGIAAAPDQRGEGLAAAVVSELVKEAAERGVVHLFLFTRPGHQDCFCSLGFFPVVETDEAVMLENRRDGLARFLRGIPVSSRKAGCIVAHANPFTWGHLALLEYAACRCERVYLFVLSERTAPFAPEERLEMAKLAAAHLPNVSVLPSGDYLISHTTFPDYFYPDRAVGRAANCRLDLMLFARKIAPALGIGTRFAGEEPDSAVTADYNRAMTEILPGEGIAVQILPRFEKDGTRISASRVRKALSEGDWETAAALTPAACHSVLRRHCPENR